MRRWTVGVTVGIAIAVAITLTACAGGGGGTDGGTGGGDGGGATSENEVVMTGNAFRPSRIEISVGDTVTWRNDDSVQHTVTGEGFDSGVLRAGETFSETFEQAGTYDYRCTIHPSMVGQVVVK